MICYERRDCPLAKTKNVPLDYWTERTGKGGNISGEAGEHSWALNDRKASGTPTSTLQRATPSQTVSGVWIHGCARDNEAKS